MSAALNERLVDIARQARAMPHGQRGTLYERASAELGMSRATLLRKLGEAAHRPRRKQREDAGTTTLTREEAELVSAVLMESTRRNGKRLMSVEQAVEILVANRKISARRFDPETGEITRLSVATVARALRLYNLHPDQLNQPAPVTELASLHPNHVWQIDPSLCVLYYLRREQDTNAGLQVMDHREFYKNKPRNLLRIEQDRVWRYVITDHCSGAIDVLYVLGAESGENLVNAFLHTAIQRDGQPFHGVPFMAMLDPGSANTGAVFKNLATALRVHVQINLPGNPRAKGQVEKANDIVERQFESGLKFLRCESLVELNILADRWVRQFNATATHGRTQQSRYGVWMSITPEQLRIAPDAALCRDLAHAAPESRVVSTKLTVSYLGQDYDVSGIPGVQVKEKLLLARNPWRPEAAQVVLIGEDGHEHYHVVEPVLRGAWGFSANAVVIGEEYARHADTPAQGNAKAIEKLLTGTDTLEAAAEARKAKALPFNGEIDPYKPITDTVLPTYLPKRGTQIHLPAQVHVEIKPLKHSEAAMQLRTLVPGWADDPRAYYQRLAEGWPEGVMEADLQHVAAVLSGRDMHQAPRLAVVK